MPPYKPSLENRPLSDIRVIEFGGLAPGPFAGLILADWGASVVRLDKTNENVPAVTPDFLTRGKRSIAVNLKNKDGVQLARWLIANADVVIDPFRPGILEKLGLGPDVFLGKDGLNKRLIFSRLAGFPKHGMHPVYCTDLSTNSYYIGVIPGPQGNMAGHDLNYLAQSGVLSMLPPVDPSGKPSFPTNIAADFAGGGMVCAMGILLALIERQKSDLGQVVDVNMVDGTKYVASFPIISRLYQGVYAKPPGQNLLDGGAPFYDIYQCKDGRWMTVACLEPKFFQVFLSVLEKTLPLGWKCTLHPWKPTPEIQYDERCWVDMRRFFKEAFGTLPRDTWVSAFQDSCATPVLDLDETMTSPYPDPAPRLSRTPALKNGAPQLESGSHTKEVLKEIGLSEDEIAGLLKEKVIGVASHRSITPSKL
ncbi:hypothetical protein FRB99_007876 [Tulasnella sp. 403]|nr:hypothetical protein FRB99_007876 [Tulasnella sp. 403]